MLSQKVKQIVKYFLFCLFFILILSGGYYWRMHSFDLNNNILDLAGKQDIIVDEFDITQVPVPAEIKQAQNMIFWQKIGDSSLNQTVWESTKTINDLVIDLQDSGGVIYFSSGDYYIDSEIQIFDISNLQIKGYQATLKFPDGPVAHVALTLEAREGDFELFVEDTGFFEVGKEYQIYASNKKGDRLLEFVVTKIKDNSIVIGTPVKYMAHVSQIPAGSLVYKTLNFIKLKDSDNIGISGLVLDGQNFGEIRGHTMYCGIFFQNVYSTYKDLSENNIDAIKSDLTKNFTVNNMVFKNLIGRALAIYAVKNVMIKDNYAENIAVEAFELDHFSSGSIINNQIKKAQVGIQLDDAYDSMVSDNFIENTDIAINIYGHFDDSWLNTGHQINDNHIVNSRSAAVVLNQNAKNNFISNNQIQTNYGKIYKGNIMENIIK